MKDFTKRQKQILNTAIELISEHGIQELTIKNLAQRIGIAESAIYRHFKSKMDILLGIISIFQQSAEDMVKIKENTTMSPVEKLHFILSNRFEYFAKNRSIATVIFSEELFRNDQNLSQKIYRTMTSIQNTIIEIIREGQKTGEIRSDVSPEHLGYMIVGALRLIVMHWRYSNFSFDLLSEGEKFWNSIKKLLAKKES